MCPSLCAQIGSHDKRMQKAAGVTPVESRIQPGWKELDTVSSELHGHMNAAVLAELAKCPRTFALCEGLCRDSTGYLWWDESWVWERWHWGRWPVERMRGTLEEIAFRIGAQLT